MAKGVKGFQKGKAKTGGRQPGSPNKMTQLARDLISDETGQKALIELANIGFDRSNKNNVKALEILLAYKYGKPQQSIDITSMDEPLQNITVNIVKAKK